MTIVEEAKTLKKYLTRRNIDIAIVVLAILFGVYLGWKEIDTLIFAIFIWIILRPIQSRLLAFPALFFLSLTPFLLILKHEEQAEQFAIYAYYFLVMAVMMGIYEVRGGKTKKLKFNSSNFLKK